MMHIAFFHRASVLAAVLSLWGSACRPMEILGQEPISAETKFLERFKKIDLPKGVDFGVYERQEPRPLRIYRLTIDLTVAKLEPVVGVAVDPDGDGPAETVLTPPKKLAKEKNMVLAINTNAWSMIPDSQTGKSLGYVVGGHADIHGWVADGERTISPVEEGYWTFWMDANLEPHLKNLAQKEMQSLAPPKIAISGFRGILSDRQILVSPSDVLHPRTSIGFNATLKQLVLVVVDGRQKKISEGVSEEELARLMLEFGCSDAINLDGGGSSVMIVRENDGDLRYINRSSDVTGVRPVPVIFGFRAR
jgi:hypothetical protein